MKRNIAFFISNNADTIHLKKALKHFNQLALRHNFKIKSTYSHSLSINIIYENEVALILNEKEISFSIGNLGSKPLEYDRHLKIGISNSKITIENDYAGSIPVYYSTREHFSISNIEPCVVLDSNTSPEDISYENVYGFMRYMHFIWDETAFNHIFCMTPDSKYIFDLQKTEISQSDLNSIISSDKNCNLNDKEVASKLNDLNDFLVNRSFENYNQILLPLSSGYDSRMIFSAVSKNPFLKEKLHCFTYGSVGSVEVEAARRLTKELDVKWDYIDLPSRFLTKDNLITFNQIFGSSLHLHGLYQLEFFHRIQQVIELKSNSCLTSGFMTGVPAGQHNSLLGIDENTSKLTECMNSFSQSRYWNDKELLKLDIFRDKNYILKAEERFRKAFDRFNGKIYQKAVMFDVWTRQRNFIGYYPRILEWVIPTVSPNMCPDYTNFFMSISRKHLNNRYAVELMFSNHYANIARIISNSHGLKSITNPQETMIFFISRVLRRFKLSFLLPTKYQHNRFDFDIPSLHYSKEESIFPLLENNKFVDDVIDKIISRQGIVDLYNKAFSGSEKAYNKLITLQAVALSVFRLLQEDDS